MERLMEFARTQTTEMLYATVRLIGGEPGVETEKALARAACLQVIEERDGVDAVDAFMDELGM